MRAYNIRLAKRPLQAEADITGLHHKEKGTATEEDFRNVLRRYNLREGLITLGKISNYIFGVEDQNKIARVAYREPSTGAIMTQFTLAYLANILLIAGTNDYKSKRISEKDNLLTLCNSYDNCLIDPVLTKNGRITGQDRFRSLMIRMHFQQMEYQFALHYMMARTIVIFNELIHRVQPDKFEPLPEIFQEETGLSIYEYLRLCAAISAGSQKTATFSISTFSNANIPQLRDVLIEEKVVKLLNILKADYRKFRKEDAYANEKLNPIFTKTRFNPLVVYPIIETDVKHPGDPYVIPNVILYIIKSFGGLYWWFHRCFESKGKQQDFRNYFGYVFQEYVGRILRGIYGTKNVHGEIPYGKDLKFIDWWVEKEDKVYLFESKAYQFALPSKQTGDPELIITNEIKKIAEAVEQVYKRIQDIPKFEELRRFRGKRAIPFIVFMDIPFVSGNLYESWIKKALEKIEQEKQITGLKDFTIFLMNIEELELFDETASTVELEDIFPKFRKDIRESFTSIVEKEKGGSLRNRYLDKVYKDFWGIDLGMITEKK